MSPMQSFITEGDLIATAPCHRDERDAVLVQLRGSKELLLHPPASELPGCFAHVFDGANESRASRWLWGFDPFQVAVCHTSSWVKVALVPERAVAVPGGWWHAVRSKPTSVAISAAVQVEQIDERVARGRRASRQDIEPVAEPRKMRRVGGQPIARTWPYPGPTLMDGIPTRILFGKWPNARRLPR
jgi:hypothetical protein